MSEMFSHNEFESLLNTCPIGSEYKPYTEYQKHGGTLPFGTYLRKNKPIEFLNRKASWDTDTRHLSIEKTSDISYDMSEVKKAIKEVIDEKVISLFAPKLCHSFKTDMGETIELKLPPVNEAEFFSKILWSQLYPDEPVEDPSFIDTMTQIFYTISDAGRLHKALQDWLTQKLIQLGRAQDVTDGEVMAQKMLDEYEDYNDLLRDLNMPVNVEQKESEEDEPEQ